jgi:hypothetical protein
MSDNELKFEDIYLPIDEKQTKKLLNDKPSSTNDDYFTCNDIFSCCCFFLYY